MKLPQICVQMQTVLGDAAIGTICLWIVISGTVAGRGILLTKAAETKGTGLTSIAD